MPHRYLEPILQAKRDDIRRLYKLVGIETLKHIATPLKNERFFEALSSDGLSLIAEVKKASPSKGIIREDFFPVEIATEFSKNGASALSVLTEPHYFLGDPAYIKAINDEVSLPILRKDFILDPIQVYESVTLGADAILLIAAILDDQELADLHGLAKELGLSVLVEVHDSEELSRVLAIPELSLIGINNRDLASFEVDPETSVILAEEARSKGFEGLIVGESGYQIKEQLDDLVESNIDAVLIGEGLAKNPDLISFFSDGTVLT